ncbi:MAG: putative quinol monooxygenase [Halioglobus sp.]|nr:putative quinol monooxygenase [Halioglobus sp.]
MIVVNGTVRSTQEAIAALQGAISAMETASRAEPGCQDYTFSIELNDSCVFRITEKWDNLESLQAHFQTPHMAEFQALMGKYPPESMEVHVYEVEEIDPF